MRLGGFLSYGEQIATNHKKIGHSKTSNHYHVLTLKEAIMGIEEAEEIMLIAELPMIGINDGGSDNIFGTFTGAYLIVKKVDQDNHEEIISAFEEMEEIGNDIMSKMVNDWKKANNQEATKPNSELKHLEVDRLRMEEVGPVLDGYVGWRIDFTVLAPDALALIESKWRGETAFDV